MKITFLGATQQVTGSKYLVEHENIKILVDCGLYQGEKVVEKQNWARLPIDPKNIDAVVLTHAHIDHSGYIPVLIKKGFKGKIYCSKATYALCTILLKNSGFIQQDEAKNAKAFTSFHDVSSLSLYTQQDAEKALTFFQVVDYDTMFSIGLLKITLIQSFHILGSSFIVISDGKTTLSFSGDLGRPNQFLMQSPAHLKYTDYLVLESTYGNKLHSQDDPMQQLSEIAQATIERNGMLIIPAFAVERTQTILYCLYQLRQKNIIPDIPIFLDSPMAISVTNLFVSFKDEHKLTPEMSQQAFSIAKFVASVQESKHIDHMKGPAIIIAGSGMADGGRVLNHMARFISDAKNTILFVGFQAEGTHGYDLVHGADEIEIHDQWYSVHASIKIINSFSAHADYNEILTWLSFLQSRPKKVFLTHGQLQASQSLQQKIEERFGWSVVVPKYLESFDLD